MARTALTIYTVGPGNTTVSKTMTTGQADGYSFENTGNEFVYLEETGGAATGDVTFKEQQTPGYYTDLVITVPLSGERFVGPFARSVFNTSGVVQVDFEAGKQTDMDIQVFRFFPSTS